MKGFSKRNLELMRQWYRYWGKDEKIAKQVVSFLFQIPWGHNIHIIIKCKDKQEAIYYLKQTINNGWSRSVLVHQIESKLYQREGKAITNFDTKLPPIQSDLAKASLKDPYSFDFLTMKENELEYNYSDDLEEA